MEQFSSCSQTPILMSHRRICPSSTNISSLVLPSTSPTRTGHDQCHGIIYQMTGYATQTIFSVLVNVFVHGMSLASCSCLVHLASVKRLDRTMFLSMNALIYKVHN
ncbi:hypothetical protein CPB86DRAFT_19946 [Serendipita vermifera]|nr:hypothetical protein CPB86DRAFT_19946 [Serendipita vermifera]